METVVLEATGRSLPVNFGSGMPTYQSLTSVARTPAAREGEGQGSEQQAVERSRVRESSAEHAVRQAP